MITEGPWQSKNEQEPYTIIGAIDGPDEGRYHYTEVCEINEEAADAEANRRLIIAAPALLKTLRAASHALRSYQYGNAATDLARSTADACDAAIVKAGG